MEIVSLRQTLRQARRTVLLCSKTETEKFFAIIRLLFLRLAQKTLKEEKEKHAVSFDVVVLEVLNEIRQII